MLNDQQGGALGKIGDVMFLLYDLGSGGTARVTALVVNGVAARGIATTLVVCRDGGVLAQMLDPRVRLITLGGRRTGRNAGMLVNCRRLAGIFRREQPSIVVSSANHMHLMAVIAHRLTGRAGKLILKMTNPVARDRLGRFHNGLRRAWYRWAFRQADRVLTITESGRDEIRAISRIGEAKVMVVDNPYITDAMIEAGRRRDEVVSRRLVAIGRLMPQKGYDLLFAALGLLSGLEWSLDLLGDGPLLEPLQRKARQLGIADRINFRGFVVDPLPYFRRAQALVLSSRWEGQGAVLLEALACGCPVVAMRSTEAVAEALGDGRFGSLTAAGDVPALAQAIADVLLQPGAVPPTALSWVGRYRLDTGIESHVKALGLTAPAPNWRMLRADAVIGGRSTGQAAGSRAGVGAEASK